MSTIDIARAIRVDALRMVHRAGSSHIGTCLSMADLLAVLYGSVLRVSPDTAGHPDRDRFILSKGHGAAALYAVLAECGFFPRDWLDTYCRDGSNLPGHVTHNLPGIELSTGSLGHGLPVGCGMAIWAKRKQQDYKTYVMLSDGELDEGSNWEAILFAAHHKLDNLVVIVDANQIQSFGAVEDVLALEPLAGKWQSFNWEVVELNGHDHDDIETALRCAPKSGRPTVFLAATTKGKGVSFMENELAWHYRSPDSQLLARALCELGEES